METGFLFFCSMVLILTLLSFPINTLAFQTSHGEDLFAQHCSGCHVKGGNIVRRGKTLKLSALKKNGINNPETIAEIALKGIGSMSGYEKVLRQGEEQLVAEWIWQQAQNAWVQG